MVAAAHVAGRAGAGALVQPAGLELGRVERAVAAEPAALHGGQATGPDRRRLPGNDPPDARVPGGEEAAEQLTDIQRAVRAARHAGGHRVALRARRDREECEHLYRAVALDLYEDVGARVRDVKVPAGVDHGVGVGVAEVLA